MRKATKRKVWYVRGSGLELAIAGATMTAQADLDKLRLLELSAIECFAKGNATRMEFTHIADMLNLTETFTTMNIGREAIPACEALQAALIEIRDRHAATGRMGVTIANLDAMREVFAFQDAQRSAVDRSTYERAIKLCANRIRSAHPSRKVLA
jgi:hypothetical protein